MFELKKSTFSRGNLLIENLIFLLAATPFALVSLFPEKIIDPSLKGATKSFADDSFYYLRKIIFFSNSDRAGNNPFIFAENSLSGFSFKFEGAIGKLVHFLGMDFTYLQSFLIVSSAFAIGFLVRSQFKNLRFDSSIAVITAFLLIIADNPNLILRPIAPGLYIAILFSSVNLVENYLKQKSKLQYVIFIAFLNHILWESYVFYGIVLSVYIFFRLGYILKCEFRGLSKLLLLVLPAVVPAIPFIVIFISGSNLMHQDMIARYGVVESHAPGSVVTNLLALVTLILLLLLSKKRILDRSLIPLLFSLVIAMNSQLVTGKSFEMEAHFGPPIRIIFLISLTVYIYDFCKELSLKYKYILGAIFAGWMIISLSTLLQNQVQLTVDDKAFQVSSDLNVFFARECNSSLAPKNVAVPAELQNIFPYYTNCLLLYSDVGVTLFPIPNKEVLKRKAFQEYVLPTNKDVDKIIQETFYRFYINHWQAMKGPFSVVRGDGLSDYEKELARFKSEYLSEKKLLKLDTYSLDFVIYSRKAGIGPDLADYCTQVIRFEHYKACRLGQNDSRK
jgi:hypothetical protein